MLFLSVFAHFECFRGLQGRVGMCCRGGMLCLHPVWEEGSGGSLSRCLVHEFVALFFLAFALAKTMVTRVSSSRMVRCIGSKRGSKGDRGRLVARLATQNMAGRRTRQVGRQCRRNRKTSITIMSRDITSRREREERSTSSRIATKAFSIVDARIDSPAARNATTTTHLIFNHGVFGDQGLAFRPGIGVTAPPGCHLNPNSRIVVSM